MRKLFSYSKKLLFITNFLKSDKLNFNSNAICHFTNYIGFQYYAVSNLNTLAFSLLVTVVEYNQNTSKFKSKRTKIFNSQFRFWLNDFYMDSKNFNSKYSSTMIQCSKLCRLNNTNFKF